MMALISPSRSNAPTALRVRLIGVKNMQRDQNRA
jgi:hypothetical protein